MFGTWVCLSPKLHGAKVTAETTLVRWAEACRVRPPWTSPCYPRSPNPLAPGVSVSSAPRGAIYSKYLRAPLGARNA